MSRTWWGKFILLAFFTVLSVVYVYPSVSGLDPQKSNFPFKQKINLGLDLQGGLYMVLGVDFNKVYKDIVDRQVANFVSRAKEKGATAVSAKLKTEGLPPEDPHVIV